MESNASLMPPEGGERSEHGSTLAAISRRVVGLLKEYYGKGPTGARTYQWGDLVVVLMQGGYTTVERTLIDGGHTQAVIDQRAQLQEVMRPRFKKVIEEELHREVLAFMSANHQDPDLNAEIFVLKPLRDGQEDLERRDVDESASSG